MTGICRISWAVSRYAGGRQIRGRSKKAITSWNTSKNKRGEGSYTSDKSKQGEELVASGVESGI